MLTDKLSKMPRKMIFNLISGECGTGPAIIDYDGYLQGMFDNILLTDCSPITSQAPTATGTGIIII
jgi:hypothetical protein